MTRKINKHTTTNKKKTIISIPIQITINDKFYRFVLLYVYLSLEYNFFSYMVCLGCAIYQPVKRQSLYFKSHFAQRFGNLWKLKKKTAKCVSDLFVEDFAPFTSRLIFGIFFSIACFQGGCAFLSLHYNNIKSHFIKFEG